MKFFKFLASLCIFSGIMYTNVVDVKSLRLLYCYQCLKLMYTTLQFLRPISLTTKLFCLNIWLISVQFFYLNYSVIFQQKGQVVIRSTIYSNLKVKYLVVLKPIYVGNLVSVLNICHFFYKYRCG